MSTLQWSDSLALDLPIMDDTHREFVDLLAIVVNASDTDILPAWKALIDHTDDHFGREDQWMRSTRFSSSNCHSMQHKVILQVMREGDVRGQAGERQVEGARIALQHNLGLGGACVVTIYQAA